MRVAGTSDHAEIVRVVNRAYEVERFFVIGDRVDMAGVLERFAKPGAWFFVIDAEESGKLSASVYFETRGDRAYFGLLAVDPEAQGRGCSRKLIEFMEAYSRTLGLKWLELDIVNLRTELPAFYAHFGFVVTGTREFHTKNTLLHPVELIVLEKPISSD